MLRMWYVMGSTSFGFPEGSLFVLFLLFFLPLGDLPSDVLICSNLSNAQICMEDH